MSKIIVTYEACWADEIDVKAALPMTKEQWDAICRDAISLFLHEDEVEHHIGTNEDICFHSYQEWYCSYTVTDVTEEEYAILIKYESLLDSGFFFIPEFYAEDYEHRNKS